MEIDVKQSKQRNKRRERAQRMQAERDKDADGVGIVDGDSADEDSKKPIRPPQRRKKANIFKEPSPILEEDVVDGFAILSFKSYEDLEYAIKLANKRNEKRLSAITELTTIMLEDKLPKIDTGQIKDEHGDGRDREREWNYKNNNHHITHTTNNIAFNHDPGTSDDSGRASERLTTSSVAQRDQDSSRDRLSDASSRCSSGKGYICDSEGDDDKASDGGSTTASTTTSAAVVPRKPVDSFQTTGVPLSNGPLGLGGSLSPVPCPPSNSGPAPPAPSPAPASLPPPSLPFATTPLQVINEPLNTHLTSLPNHVGSIQNNGQQQTSTTTATIPNGKVPASATVNNNNNNNNSSSKLPTTCTTTSLSSPNSKQTMVSSPSAGSPGGQTTTTVTSNNNNNNSNSSNNSSKKHSPTISNLLAPTTSTVTTTSNVQQQQQQQAPITTSVMAIPSPVSSTSSLSSISIPSRLGSSTPPVNPASNVNNSTNTPTSTVQTPPTSIQPQQQQQQTPQIQSTQHQQQQQQQPQPPSIPTQSIPQHPTIDQMTNQQLQSISNASLLPTSLGIPPTLNGPGIPTMMGLGGLGPLGHLAAPPYRALYPYGLYSPYGMPPHPYGAMPPTPIPPSALSPRSSDGRRDSSPLVLSKPIKSVTPNSNSQPTNNNLQSSSNSTTPAGPNYNSSSSAATNSPRSYSPSREKDNFSVSSLSSKSTTVTPSSSVISYNNTGPTGQPPSANMPPIMGNSPSLLAPYSLPGQPPVITSSAASSLYPGSSLSYPTKIPGFPPPSSWPPPLSSASSMSSPIITTMAGPGLGGRPTPIIPTSVAPSPSFGPSPSFAAPLPPPSAVPTSVASVNSHPFSAESLLTNKPDQADLLRRELDNRFLDRSGLNQPPSAVIPTSSIPSSPVTSAIASIPTSSSSRPSAQATPPGSANNSNSASNSGSAPTTPTAQQSASNIPFLRQELHHHQHQHTHLHQHQHQHQALLPGAPSASIFPPPLFKDIPKLGAGDSPFYRTAPLMGMPPYPYPSGILHPGLSGPTQFVPPSHLQSFVPKQQGPPAVVDPTKPKQVKTGRWNAMHVRIAWEIYHHQAKQNPEKASSAAGVKPETMLRPMYPPPSSPSVRTHELTTPSGFPQAPPPSMQGRPFDPMTANFLSSPSGLGVSPFGRYGSPFGSPFSGLSPYSREMQLGGPLDPWRNSALGRNMGYPPPPQALTAAWPMKPDPGLDAARREAEERERQMREREERERQRREREEKERKEREREEKLRKEQQEREQRERERERKEKERREMERREMERERMLQQQRLNDSAKLVRDRSPLRNGDSDIRVKEEPRKDEAEMLMRTDPRYQMAAWQMASRNPTHMLPPPHLTRGGMIGPPGSFVGLPPHYPPTPGWPPGLDPYRDPYRLMDPMLRSYPINPMLDAMRAEEAKAYAQATALYRGKDHSPVPQQGHPPTVPSPHHHRLPPNGPMKPPSVGPLPITANDMHKKEDAPR